MRIPSGDTVARPVCGACGHIVYENPKILVACVLYEENRILWIKRGIEPYRGRWALPAGFMESGETIRQTACREVLEETRIVMLPQTLSVYGVFSIPQINQVYVSLIAPLPSKHFAVTPEATEISLLTEEETHLIEFAYPPQTIPYICEVYRCIAAGFAACDRAVLADLST